MEPINFNNFLRQAGQCIGNLSGINNATQQQVDEMVNFVKQAQAEQATPELAYYIMTNNPMGQRWAARLVIQPGSTIESYCNQYCQPHQLKENWQVGGISFDAMYIVPRFKEAYDGTQQNNYFQG